MPKRSRPESKLSRVARRSDPNRVAFEAMLDRIESLCGAPIAEVHKRLDRERMRGKPFLDILRRVSELYGTSEFYSGVIARTYPGYKGANGPRTDLRAYLERGA